MKKNKKIIELEKEIKKAKIELEQLLEKEIKKAKIELEQLEKERKKVWSS